MSLVCDGHTHRDYRASKTMLSFPPAQTDRTLKPPVCPKGPTSRISSIQIIDAGDLRWFTKMGSRGWRVINATAASNIALCFGVNVSSAVSQGPVFGLGRAEYAPEGSQPGNVRRRPSPVQGDSIVFAIFALVKGFLASVFREKFSGNPSERIFCFFKHACEGCYRGDS